MARKSVSLSVGRGEKLPVSQGAGLTAKGRAKYNAATGDFIKYGNGDYLNWPTHRFDGQDYQIIQEADVCAVVEPDESQRDTLRAA